MDYTAEANNAQLTGSIKIYPNKLGGKMIPRNFLEDNSFMEHQGYERELITKFITFFESKGIELGGFVTCGFAMERTEFAPMHKDDYQNLINDFLFAIKTKSKEG